MDITGFEYLGAFRCADGSHLVMVNGSLGASAGWFRIGEAFHAVTGEVARDEGYAAAYRECRG